MPDFGIRYAPYATRPEDSRGRRHGEPESAVRTPFQRDRDRIVHSAAFRRLKHKTQVFVVSHEGDHYRTRLTHSLEVAQIARTVCRRLGLNEDLAECLALAHDLGHTPFGHAGEEALNEAMAEWGGFDHNAQTLRILTRLERKYAEFDGLNLTWETLEGVVKHNGPLVGPAARKPLPDPIRDYSADHDLELGTWPGPEAQVAAICDDIAYNNHDIDDGLRAGLFAIDDLKAVPFVWAAFEDVRGRYGALDTGRWVNEAVRRLIDAMVRDLLEETNRRLAAAPPASAAAIRAAGRATVAFSPAMAANDKALKAFLFARMYRHYRVNRMTSKAWRVVRDLFGLFLAEPELLPAPWQAGIDGPRGPRTARLAADYIAGMTDRFALDEHRRLFDPALPS
jgi:dGTPase